MSLKKRRQPAIINSMTPPALARRFSVESAGPVQAGLALRVGLAGFALALPALILLQYALPEGARARYWGLNPQGMEQFRAHLGLTHLPTLSPDLFSLGFRALLMLLWTAYALALLAEFQGRVLKARPVVLMISLTAIVAAVFAPPLLSTDVYAYAGHGRIFALYGQNPYLCLPIYLLDAHDPVARFLAWNWPTVYGPVWTRIEIAVVALLHGSGLWPQIVGLKMVQGVALVMAALAGRRITQILSPGRENLTLLAIGLNPLLVFEGPGSGHNDLLMVSFLLVGAMFYLEKKYLLASLFLGLSVGVKMLTLAVLPWALMDYGRGKSWPRRIGGAAIALAFLLLPLVICYGRLWAGVHTLGSISQRATLNGSEVTFAQDMAVRAWLLAHGAGTFLTILLSAFFHHRLVVAAYLALTFWLWRRPAPARWLQAWAVLAVPLMLFALGLPFPWYISWFLPVCLLRWDRLHIGLSAACFGLSLVWMSGYAILAEP